MESTLSLQYRDLAGEVGAYLGYGRGTDLGDRAWTEKQAQAVRSCLASGLRQFYFPPPLKDEGSSYDWSFLKPVRNLTLASGAHTVALPDDFGGIEGPITLSSDSAQVPWEIPINLDINLNQMYSVTPDATGRPMYAAIQWLKGTSPQAGQRAQLLVYPIADAAYTLQVCYYILPDYLSGQLPYAYGGAQHAETILESCLAIAEQRLDDSSGVHSEKFRERLAASISLDRRSKPQNLGYNADRSDGYYARHDRHYLGRVTYNGS